MDLLQVKEIISMGENSNIEFKNSSVRPESIAKEMVAFSNSTGGTILIGIDDNSDILGCDKSFNHEEWIMNISRTSVIPSIIPEYQEIEIDNKKIVILTIIKGKNKPYQTNDNKFLVRVGSTNRTATQVELLRLFQQSGFFHYDLVGVPQTSIQSLNLSQIDNYFNKYNISFYEELEQSKIQLLKNVDILSEEGECTIAGLLLFGVNPQRNLQNASISVAKFRGTQVDSTLIDNKVIEGSITNQVDSATALINTLIPMPSEIVGNKRVDTNPTFSKKVFRELLVNAVVHRNYSIEGSRIRVFIFDNRLEIRSPGRLPNTITTEKIISGVSYAVNPVLVKFMENLRYIDKLGRGIPMVCHEAKTVNKNVTFQEIGEEFVVTLEI